MKKLGCVLLVLLMLLSLASCTGKDKPAPTAIPDYTALPVQTQEASATEAAPESTAVPFPEQSAESAKFVPETDADNRCTTTNSALIWNDGGFYWYSCESDYLLYYDEGLEEMMPVCPKPECEHYKDGNVWYQNKSCGAYLDASRNPSIYNGKLYYVNINGKANPNTNGQTGGYMLYRMEPDGSQKEFIKDVFPPGYDSPQWFIVHRGYLYAMSVENSVKNGEPYSCTYILGLPLEGEGTTFRVLYKREDSGWGGMRFVGDNCYFYIRYTEGDYVEDENENIIAYPDCGAVIGRLNIEKNAVEILYDSLFPDGLGLGDIWVDGDETIYVNLSYGFYRFENGEFVKLFDFEDGESSYYPHFIMDGTVIAFAIENEVEPPQIDLWVRRFDGSEVYKGPLPLEWMEALDGKAKFDCISSIIADGEDIYCEFGVYWRTPNRQDEPRARYLVRCTFEDGGIEWKLLGSYYQKIMNYD